MNLRTVESITNVLKENTDLKASLDFKSVYNNAVGVLSEMEKEFNRDRNDLKDRFDQNFNSENPNNEFELATKNLRNKIENAKDITDLAQYLLEVRQQTEANLKKEEAIQQKISVVDTELKEGRSLDLPELEAGQGLVKNKKVYAEIKRIDKKGIYLRNTTADRLPLIKSGYCSPEELQDKLKRYKLKITKEASLDGEALPTKREVFEKQKQRLTLNLLQSQLNSKIDIRLKDPEFKKNWQMLSILNKHREELSQKIDALIRNDYLPWVKNMNNDNGFRSVFGLVWNKDIEDYGRFAVGFKGKLIKGAENSNPETFWKEHDYFVQNYPQKEELFNIAKNYACVQKALENIQNREAIDRGIDSQNDQVVHTLTEWNKNKQENLTLQDGISSKIDYVRNTYGKDNIEEAGMVQFALTQEYLNHSVDGESFNRLKNGQRSLMATINSLILAGEIEGVSLPIVSSEDLNTRLYRQIYQNPKALAKINYVLGNRFLRNDKNINLDSIYKIEYQPLQEKIKQEVMRLKNIEKDSEIGLTQNKLVENRELFEDIHSSAKWKNFWRGSGEFMTQIFDDPSTYAMVAVGAMTGGVGAGVLRGTQISSQAMRFILSSGIDAAMWHTGMNVFYEVAGRKEETTWDAGSYLNSWAMFMGMKGVGMRAKTRMKPLMEKIESGALFGWKKTSRLILEGVRSKGEGVLVLSGLAGIENYFSKDGFEADKFVQSLQRNYQFLVAMSFIHGVLGKFGKVNRFKKRVDRYNREFERKPTDENLQKLLKAHMDFSQEMHKVMENEYYSGEKSEKPKIINDNVLQNVAEKNNVPKEYRSPEHFLINPSWLPKEYYDFLVESMRINNKNVNIFDFKRFSEILEKSKILFLGIDHGSIVTHEYIANLLSQIKSNKKPVLAIEYPPDMQANIDLFIRKGKFREEDNPLLYEKIYEELRSKRKHDISDELKGTIFDEIPEFIDILPVLIEARKNNLEVIAIDKHFRDIDNLAVGERDKGMMEELSKKIQDDNPIVFIGGMDHCFYKEYVFEGISNNSLANLARKRFGDKVSSLMLENYDHLKKYAKDNQVPDSVLFGVVKKIGKGNPIILKVNNNLFFNKKITKLIESDYWVSIL